MHILTSIFALLLLLLPEVIFAQVNQSLINFNLNAQTGTDGFSNYVNLIYALSISAAALLAVIKIIIAGVKYMLTDVVTSKGDAIKEIKGALFGLLLIISAVLILTVINPQLIKSTLTFNPQPMPEVNVTPPVTSTGPSVDESGNNPPPAPQEFPIGTGYSVLNSVGNVDLSESYFDRANSRGNVIVYNANQHCRYLLDTAEEQAEYGDRCLETIRTILYETCSVFSGALCNTGWCTHNAGVRAGDWGCRLPYQRFTSSQVESKYREITSAQQQENSLYGRAQFNAGCQALGGVVANINLYSDSGLDNLRCVKR